MRLVLLGGGGFRVPLVHRALLDDEHAGRVDELVLHDVDEGRLETMTRVLAQQGAGAPRPVTVRATARIDEALEGADFIFSAIRVGGLSGRTLDERIALDHAVLGQETVGAGGISYGLRTVPVAVGIAERIAALAPNAWLINFTNPAGLITQAIQAVLGDRAIGICDSPVGLGRRAATALGFQGADVQLGYAGLNHLGWVDSLVINGVDRLPDLLADDAALLSIEEGRLFGTEWIQSLAMLPNEYLYYYYFTREAVAAIMGEPQTRGEFLLDQQTGFYQRALAAPSSAYRQWRSAWEDRETTYMREVRQPTVQRDARDFGGGYERVALALMAAIAHDEPARLVLNVRNRGAVECLGVDAVVEVPCLVDAGGPVPQLSRISGGHERGLVQQVKAAEELTIEAALTGSRRRAVEAFATHPLVDSVGVARDLFDAYAAAFPQLGAIFAAQPVPGSPSVAGH